MELVKIKKEIDNLVVERQWLQLDIEERKEENIALTQQLISAEARTNRYKAILRELRDRLKDLDLE